MLVHSRFVETCKRAIAHGRRLLRQGDHAGGVCGAGVGLLCPSCLGSGQAGETGRVLGDHAETIRATRGGRKASDPGNTRDTGKANGRP